MEARGFYWAFGPYHIMSMNKNYVSISSLLIPKVYFRIRLIRCLVAFNSFDMSDDSMYGFYVVPLTHYSEPQLMDK